MKWLKDLFSKQGEPKNENKDSLDKHEQALYRVGREQFIKLKEKGLSIPIFTL